MELHPLRIILSSSKDRRKQDDHISIQIHLDQSKAYLLPSSVGCDKASFTELHLPSKVGSRPYRVRSVQQNSFWSSSCKASTEQVDDNLSFHLQSYQAFMANMSSKREKFDLILHCKLRAKLSSAIPEHTQSNFERIFKGEEFVQNFSSLIKLQWHPEVEAPRLKEVQKCWLEVWNGRHQTSNWYQQLQNHSTLIVPSLKFLQRYSL